jgi:hypothetical protein
VAGGTPETEWQSSRWDWSKGSVSSLYSASTQYHHDHADVFLCAAAETTYRPSGIVQGRNLDHS